MKAEMSGKICSFKLIKIDFEGVTVFKDQREKQKERESERYI